MQSFPHLRNSVSSEKEANMFPRACNASKGGKETDNPCSENWVLPTPFSQDLVLTSMKEGRKEPASLTVLVPPTFLREKV